MEWRQQANEQSKASSEHKRRVGVKVGEMMGAPGPEGPRSLRKQYGAVSCVHGSSVYDSFR